MKLPALVACLSLTALPALAQDPEVDGTVQVQLPSVSMSVRVNQAVDAPAPGPAPAPRPPPAQVVGAEDFDVAFDMQPQEALRLLSPEVAHADIWADDGSYVGGFDLPTEVRASPAQFYRVRLTANGVVILDRKLELRRYFSTIVTARRAPSAPAPRQAAPVLDFGALLEAVKAESFSDAKLDVVRTSQGGLTVDQLGQLIALFSFSAEQVKVVELCQHRLVDRENAFKLSKLFTFEADKKKVKAILGR
jgi:hypothetical protein